LLLPVRLYQCLLPDTHLQANSSINPLATLYLHLLAFSGLAA